MMKEKEKIIKIVNDCVQYNANQGTWSIDNRFADELLALIEKEKKEQVREILQDLKDMMIIPEFTLHLILNTLSQKYGVRL